MGWYSGRHRGDAEKQTGLYPHGAQSRKGDTRTKHIFFKVIMASQVAQAVKNLPAMWETGVQSLGWEDPLEKGMATHSSILA